MDEGRGPGWRDRLSQQEKHAVKSAGNIARPSLQGQVKRFANNLFHGVGGEAAKDSLCADGCADFLVGGQTAGAQRQDVCVLIPELLAQGQSEIQQEALGGGVGGLQRHGEQGCEAWRQGRR